MVVFVTSERAMQYRNFGFSRMCRQGQTYRSGFGGFRHSAEGSRVADGCDAMGSALPRTILLT